MVLTAEPHMTESVDELIRTISDLKGRLDQSQVRRCVMFADMVGSTAFFDRHGNVDGRLRVDSADRAVTQTAKRFGGRVVKTLGDGWLLVFLDPLKGLQAAIEMQKRIGLMEQGKADPIELKVGMDYGFVLEESADVYGDVVNVAKRLAESGSGGDILISPTAYESIDPYYQVRCDPVDDLLLRGKTGKAAGYRVQWRGGERSVPRPSSEKIRLEVLWRDTESRVTWKSSEETSGAILPFDSHTLDIETIQATSARIMSVIRDANLDGGGQVGLSQLRTLGEQFFDLLFSQETRNRIRKTTAECLTLHLDDACVPFPWELAHDGTDFLCCRFAMGRIARTGQAARVLHRPTPRETVSILTVSDPCGNLPAAQIEGMELYHLCQLEPRVRFEMLNGHVSRQSVKSRLAAFDMVHYCGHSEHDSNSPDQSSWILGDGRLTAGDIRDMVINGEAGPLLVFNNACQSGVTSSWSERPAGWSFGLANAFLLAGCTHYIGAVSDLLDLGSKDFARLFYQNVIAGFPVGKALRETRIDHRKESGESNLTWAQYILYGEPDISIFNTDQVFMEQRVEAPMAKKAGVYRVIASVDLAHYSEIVASLEKRHGLGPNATMALQTQIQEMLRKGCERAGVCYEDCLMDFSGDGSLFAFEAVDKAEEFAEGVLFASQVWNETARSNEEYRCFRVGIYDGEVVEDLDDSFSGSAVTAAVRLQHAGGTGEILVGSGVYEKLPPTRQSVYGDLEWVPGKKHDDPFAAHRRAIAPAAPWEHKAVELERLLRSNSTNSATTTPAEAPLPISVLKGISTKNVWLLAGILVAAVAASWLVFHEKQPSNPLAGSQAILDRADIDESEGDFSAAISVLEEGLRIDPDNKFYQNRLRDLRGKLRLSEEARRRSEIEAGLAAVETAIEKNPERLTTGDRWTSRPLTIAVLEFEPDGEVSGEDAVGLSDEMRKHFVDSGWNVVSKDTLVEALEQLRLTASTAADARNYAGLGRLLAARVLVFGKIASVGGKQKLSISAIDTETTVSIALLDAPESEDLKSNLPPLAARVAAEISSKYPARGKILRLDENRVVLNIGANLSVQVGSEYLVYPAAAQAEFEDSLVATESIGRIRILDVDETTSRAEVLKADIPLDQGMRAAISQARN